MSRKYDSQEITRIMQRAAERQEIEAKRRRRREDGLTLGELEQIASEAGIDPRHVRAIAAHVDAPWTPPEERSGQTKTHVFAERWVPGALTSEAWDDVVALLREHYHTNAGEIDQIGTTREWNYNGALNPETRITIGSRGKGQRVRLSQRVGYGSELTEALFMIGPVMALLAFSFAFAFSKSSGVGVGWALAVYLVTAVISFFGDRAWRQKRQEKMDGLAERIEHLMLDANEELTEENRAEPAIDLDALPPAPEQERTSTGRRIRQSD